MSDAVIEDENRNEYSSTCICIAKGKQANKPECGNCLQWLQWIHEEEKTKCAINECRFDVSSHGHCSVAMCQFSSSKQIHENRTGNN